MILYTTVGLNSPLNFGIVLERFINADWNCCFLFLFILLVIEFLIVLHILFVIQTYSFFLLVIHFFNGLYHKTCPKYRQQKHFFLYKNVTFILWQQIKFESATNEKWTSTGNKCWSHQSLVPGYYELLRLPKYKYWLTIWITSTFTGPSSKKYFFLN